MAICQSPPATAWLSTAATAINTLCSSSPPRRFPDSATAVSDETEEAGTCADSDGAGRAPYLDTMRNDMLRPEDPIVTRDYDLKSNLPPNNNKNHPIILALTLIFSTFYVAGIITKVGIYPIYPLDDTYIAMAIARTFADSGVWGISSFDPGAASSSPIYVFILVFLYLLIGPSPWFEWSPLIVNAVAMIGCFVAWNWILSEVSALTKALSAVMRFIMLAVLAAATPLWVVTVIGMEHTIQCLIDVVLIFYGSRAVSATNRAPWAEAALLFMATFVAVGLRYEGALIATPLSIVALLNKKLLHAAAFGLGTIGPIYLFGLIWHGNDGWLLPTSILMKLVLHNKGHVVQYLPAAITLGGVMAVNAGLMGWRLQARLRTNCPSSIFKALIQDWVFVFTGTTIAAAGVQLLLGAVGWLYRYEAAILSVNCVSIVILVALDHQPRTQALILAGLALVVAWRSIDAVLMVVEAPSDRRWEHVAPAEFVGRFYPSSAVVASDVGAMAWYAPSSRVLDLAGLANNDIARMRMASGGLEWPAVDRWARQAGAPLAVIQVCWPPVADVLPDTWRLVALWFGPQNIVFGDNMVGFFATSEADVATLKQNMQWFQPPEGVNVFYLSYLPEAFQVELIRVLREKRCQAVPGFVASLQDRLKSERMAPQAQP